jgi:hypothetical protein
MANSLLDEANVGQVKDFEVISVFTQEHSEPGFREERKELTGILAHNLLLTFKKLGFTD